MRAPDLAAVGELVQDVAHRVVLPRFRDLAAGEISEKSPGDLVTAVDVEAEQVITAGLAELSSGIPVVGEEAVEADPSLLDLLGGDGYAFVVDPIDGTRAFVEGDPDFAVMVALVDSGVPVASWIALPAYGELFTAERGAGAFVTRGAGEPERLVGGDDETSSSGGAGAPGGGVGGRVTRAVPGQGTLQGAGAEQRDRVQPGTAARADRAVRRDGTVHEVRGGVATAFLPDGLREQVGERVEQLAPHVRGSARLWAGATYRRVLLGEDDFIVYWRTNAWDHAPGTVLVREIGGSVTRWDGDDYRVDDSRTSLLVAANARTAATVRSTLLP